MQNQFLALFIILLPTLGYSFSSQSMFLGRIARTSVFQQSARRTPSVSTTSLFMSSERKAGVASPEELRAFVESSNGKILVVDARNADADVEPGDQKSLAVAPLPSGDVRPKAVNLIWDREAKSMPLPDVDKDTSIITHCGGGGRGQKAKDFLEANGFTNVMNGGGPKETDCWNEFGEL